MRTIALYGTIAAFIFAALFLFALNGGSELASDALQRLKSRPFAQYPPPASHHGPSISHSQSHISPAQKSWTFDYTQHARNYGLSVDQCDSAFPDLYKEIDRAVAYRRDKAGDVTIQELEVGWRGDGIVRARIQDNQLYIIDAHGVWDHNHRPRSIATLHSLHRAITAYSEPLPNVEFTLTDHDSALIDEDGNQTTWSYSRLAHQESLWLMPEFGFWAWPNVGLRSYAELQSILDREEDEFVDKVPKVVWRGTLNVGSGLDARAGLIEHSSDQPWSDVQILDWDNATDIAEKLLTMEDHCEYMFAAQTEGNTYSGRLKYLLNCHSVVMSHELHWIEHFHHLLHATGKAQNFVRLRRDFSDLPAKMSALLKPGSLPRAKAIATNARTTFRERYLTPAAEACYWRALIRGWASVQGFEPQAWVDVGEEEEDWRGGGKRAKRRPRGVPFESYVIMEQTEWPIPAPPRRVCLEEELAR